MESIEIKNLNKSINNKKILNDISFSLNSGSITVLLGPNGSGKTTLLKVLSNLISFDLGEIIFNKSLNLNRKDIMMVFDEPILYEELTGIEHVHFNMDIFKISLSDDEIDYYINLFQLNDYMLKRISTYSLGTKKKLQLLCTLINNPRILLLDEYISGLDPVTLYQVKNILKEYASKGNTVLLTTHMLDIAEKICDYVILIDNGIVHNNVLWDIDNIKNEYNSLEHFYIKSICAEVN